MRVGFLLFFRVGFPLQAAFWIVLVSFLLTGGDYESARHAQGFAAPARQTAGRVVEAVVTLPRLCDDHAKLCETARGAVTTLGHWASAAKEPLSGLWSWSSARVKEVARKD